jgi:hypothetical protein
VDSFFNALRDKILKRNRTAKGGAIDVLQGRIDAFQAEKEAAERARLEAERLEAHRKALEASRKAAEEAAAAEAARVAAERARKPETSAAKSAAALAQETAAAESAIRAQQALDDAEEARLNALARTPDLVRTRGQNEAGAGVLLTTRREDYAILVDRSLIDMNALRPYFTEAEIEKALRGWAKATGYRQPMPGAEVGSKNKGVTR